MGFELKYYICPKCQAPKLAKNLDNGNFVCDNAEGGCTHFIKAGDFVPKEEAGASSRSLGVSLAQACRDIYATASHWELGSTAGSSRWEDGREIIRILKNHGLA